MTNVGGSISRVSRAMKTWFFEITILGIGHYITRRLGQVWYNFFAFRRFIHEFAINSMPRFWVTIRKHTMQCNSPLHQIAKPEKKCHTTLKK